MEFGDLLTQAGLSAFVLLAVGVIKKTLPSFDSERFGAITAIGIGVVVAVAASLTNAGGVTLPIAEAVFLGAISGAAASGLYDAGSGVTS